MLVGSLDGFAIITMDESGTISSWNSGAEKLFGYKGAQIIGDNIALVLTIDKRDAPAHLRALEKSQLKSETDHVRHYLRRDGSIFWGSGIISRLNDIQHKQQGFTLVLRDVSKQKELDGRKDAFISTATHELKTPITSMRLFAGIVTKQALSGGDEISIESAKKLSAQLDRIIALMDYLLDVAKIQQGKLNLEKTYFKLDTLVAELAATMQVVSPYHTIRRQGKVADEVFADKDRVEQVMMNLISNAVKYSPDGKTVVIRSVEQKRNVIVSVQDFGPGIPMAEQAIIFERFYRTVATAETNINGIGLGLYIVQKIVGAHKGKSWVESTEGKGSTFYFSIPTKKKPVVRKRVAARTYINAVKA